MSGQHTVPVGADTTLRTRFAIKPAELARFLLETFGTLYDFRPAPLFWSRERLFLEWNFRGTLRILRRRLCSEVNMPSWSTMPHQNATNDGGYNPLGAMFYAVPFKHVQKARLADAEDFITKVTLLLLSMIGAEWRAVCAGFPCVPRHGDRGAAGEHPTK